MKQYLFNMNDFYWINIPDSNLFYIIPEITLYKRGFIQYDENLNIVIEESSPKMFLNIQIYGKK